jgi:hypothetical protein
MPAERRERVTGIGIVRVNGQPEELDGPDGRRQPSIGGTSRISREAYVRICERLGVKLPGRLGGRPATAAPLGINRPSQQQSATPADEALQSPAATEVAGSPRDVISYYR